MNLSPSIETLPLIGPTYAKRLKRLEINTLEDLLYHFPTRYNDLRLVTTINSIQPGETVTIKGEIISSQNIFVRSGKKIQKITIADKTGHIEATWFNQPFIITTLKKGLKVAVSGKVDIFAFKATFTSPEYEIIRDNQPFIHTSRLVPIYPQTRALSSKWLRSRIAPIILKSSFSVDDWLPNSLKRKQNLIPLGKALKKIHFPDSDTDQKSARKRLAFDELFLLQLASQSRKALWKNKKSSHALTIDQKKINHFTQNLPFTLTQAQNKTTKEILGNLNKTQPMNRLLQGDVGSGKTVVAAIAIYAAYLNGLKSALMAPTEILALQHEKTIRSLLEPMGVKISTHTSSKKLDARRSQLNADVYIGTHALLFRKIPKDLGLLVIDEQHRFGVKQRAKLLKAPKTPHLLSMTATPIPRTIALTLYGEMDLSVIDQMPKGRKIVKTWVVPKKKRNKAYSWIQKQITTQKTQAFVVCPLIQESQAEKLTQVKAAETEYQFLKEKIFPDLKIGLLHGRMKAKDKQSIITRFRQKKLNLLVSTPVIEVGIDIPGATIIVIEAAERFGLAQLHQLRGRVGRGDDQSYALLFASTTKSQSLKRLKAMETQNSGFTLAELDLKLRGPGQIHGIKQHGFTKLKIASFSDQILISQTHKLAKTLISQDQQLKKYPKLAQKLSQLTKDQIEPN